MRIAFATYASQPHLQPEDREIARLLAEQGIQVDAVVWDAEGVDWSVFRAVVPRSPWDYYRKPERFRAWLDRLDTLGVVVLNETPVLRANMDKRYLASLSRDGFRIVPTVWASTDADLSRVRAETGWATLVLKPVISAGAFHTVIVPPEDTGEEALRAIGTGAPVMIQPFIASIRDAGEWSLIYFDGTFSHAVCKRPKPGDFRVQERHGGVTRAEAPRPDWISIGQELIASLPSLPLYARVDGLVVEGHWALMELELIEPCLFTDYDSGAPERFTNALLARLRYIGCG